MNRDALKKKFEKISRAKEDYRYKDVVGFLAHKGLLITNIDYDYKERLDVGHALWAAKLEPRILEVLPAAIVHFPKSIENEKATPKVLKNVINAINNNEMVDGEYKGIKFKAMKEWADSELNDKRVVPISKKRKQMNFRLDPMVIDKLKKISKTKKMDLTSIIEEAILNYQC